MLKTTKIYQVNEFNIDEMRAEVLGLKYQDSYDNWISAADISTGFYVHTTRNIVLKLSEKEAIRRSNQRNMPITNKIPGFAKFLKSVSEQALTEDAEMKKEFNHESSKQLNDVVNKYRYC